MEIIKYLFEGFFITIVGMYLIGKEFNADNTVIMAAAIAGLLMITESIGSIYRYSKKKIARGVSTLERQIGGMDGTMSLQTALQMQKMLERQTGGCAGSKKMKTACDNASNASNDELTYGQYANYEKVYNMPQIPINKKEMELLRSENKLPHVNNLDRSITARRKQAGGAADEAEKTEKTENTEKTKKTDDKAHEKVNDKTPTSETDTEEEKKTKKTKKVVPE